MNKIVFDKGIKTYQINDDENAVISFSTSDFKILDRAEEVQKNITAKLGEYDKLSQAEGENTPESVQKLLNDCDEYIREQIDYLFDSAVSDSVFGNMNCVSIVNGKPVCVAFLEAVMPIIEKDLMSAGSSANVKKYTERTKKR